MKERRKHHRVDSLNLLSYVCTDEEGEIVTQGVGRTVNASEGGILMETHVAIHPEHRLSLFIAMEDDLVDIKGKVIHCRTGEDGKFLTGIQFVDVAEVASEILKKIIALCEHD